MSEGSLKKLTGDWLRNFRKENDVTLLELEEASGVSSSAISRFERYNAEITSSTESALKKGIISILHNRFLALEKEIEELSEEHTSVLTDEEFMNVLNFNYDLLRYLGFELTPKDEQVCIKYFDDDTKEYSYYPVDFNMLTLLYFDTAAFYVDRFIELDESQKLKTDMFVKDRKKEFLARSNNKCDSKNIINFIRKAQNSTSCNRDDDN